MLRCLAGLVLLLGQACAQDAQTLACQSDLVSMSDRFNAACCSVRFEVSPLFSPSGPLSVPVPPTPPHRSSAFV